MRFLLNSLLLTLCISCTSYPKKNSFKPTELSSVSIVNPYFSNTTQDYIYKANISAFDNNFGGIFIVKKLGVGHHRIVFTTELGNKIFDFTFEGDDFQVNHILKDLDKKPLINILKEDFKVLVMENPAVAAAFLKQTDIVYKTNLSGKKHFYFIQKEKLTKIIKTKNGQPNVEFLFSEINDDLAKHIEINHKKIRLSIRLKSI